MNDLDLWHEPYIICPHCRHRHEDDLHMWFGDDWEDCTDMECSNCLKEFHAERCVEISYNTSKIGDKDL